MYALRRSVAFSILPLLFVLPFFPPENGAPAGEENLYSRALLASIIEMNKAYGHIDDSDGGSRVRTDYHHMLVERDPGITDDLPEQFAEYRVAYLDTQQLIARYKELRKEFSILKIQPMRSEGASLKVLVSVYWVSYKNKKLNLGLSDWSEVEFRYDCEKQSFVVSEVKLGGV